jgi:hypothetical protein
VRQEDLGGEHEHDPVPRRCGPLQIGEVTARVLEQRAFVDHRQLEVRVRVVDRLATGLRQDDERERDRGQRQRRARPHLRPRGGGYDARQVGRACHERRDRKRQDERRLDERRDREVPAGAHQREAVRHVPRRRREREARKRQQPEQRQRVVTDAERRGMLRDGDEQHRGGDGRRDHARREPVDERRSLHRDGALVPEPSQLAVRLQGRRPAPTLESRLPVLHEPRQQRREGDAARELHGAGRRRRAAHPITPSLAAPRRTTTRPSR